MLDDSASASAARPVTCTFMVGDDLPEADRYFRAQINPRHEGAGDRSRRPTPRRCSSSIRGPATVRELENALIRACVLAGSPHAHGDRLPTSPAARRSRAERRLRHRRPHPQEAFATYFTSRATCSPPTCNALALSWVERPLLEFRAREDGRQPAPRRRHPRHPTATRSARRFTALGIPLKKK